jgi:hypothetical protein
MTSERFTPSIRVLGWRRSSLLPVHAGAVEATSRRLSEAQPRESK